MISPRTAIVRGAFALSAVALAASCSSGTGSISKSDVEKKAATQLAAAVKSSVKPDIACPGDLPAKTGAKMDCVLSVKGEADRYAVHVAVTGVSKGTYHLSFKVADTPLTTK